LTRRRAVPGPPPPQLDAPCRRWLLQRARLALHSHFTRTPVLPPETLPWTAEQLHGCFVTLYSVAGTARGCLGTCEPTMPLYQHIEQLTLSAALTDARYAPVAVGDLQQLVIEIAVLSPQQTIEPAAVQVGTHGLWVQADVGSAVMLPHVASSYGWDRRTYLQQACIAAGLPADAYGQLGTQLQAFTAQTFAENTHLT
jgi:AmmeMemoRadiSam system protein A